MTIQDLGSIGELTAAVATIATLIYLARQLRSNTEAVRGEARRGQMESSAAANLTIASDPQIAALFNAGIRDFKGLPPEQSTQFTFLIASMIGSWQVSHEEFASGLTDKETLEDVTIGYLPIIRAPGTRQWWAAYRTRYNASFRDYVDERLQSPGE